MVSSPHVQIGLKFPTHVSRHLYSENNAQRSGQVFENGRFYKFIPPEVEEAMTISPWAEVKHSN